MRAAQNAAESAERPGRTILDAPAIARVIDRIAHEIIERSGDDHLPQLTLLGIPTRGGPLAQRLAQRIGVFTGRDSISVGTVDPTLYRDDLRSHGVRPLSPTSIPDGGIDGRHVVLVDDVLYSGRTIRAAMDALREVGRPRVVQLAVLVDRGHRELPIRADYVGKNLPTSALEQVRVRLTEIDGSDEVLVLPRSDPPTPRPVAPAAGAGTHR